MKLLNLKAERQLYKHNITRITLTIIMMEVSKRKLKNYIAEATQNIKVITSPTITIKKFPTPLSNT